MNLSVLFDVVILEMAKNANGIFRLPVTSRTKILCLLNRRRNVSRKNPIRLFLIAQYADM